MNFHPGLLFQPELQLSQRQVGLLLQPLAEQGLFGGADLGLAPGLEYGPSHAPGTRIGRRDLFGPPQTDAELRRQLFKRAVTLFVGRQKIATILPLVGFSHTRCVAEESPTQVYIIMHIALNFKRHQYPLLAQLAPRLAIVARYL